LVKAISVSSLFPSADFIFVLKNLGREWSPVFWRTEDIRILLLDSSDYRQFIKYKWSDLSRNKEKVRVKVIVTEFEYPLFWMKKTETAYNRLKVLSIDKFAGETHWDK
jgi:hypothetical protein